jgi:hypothetical protein
MVHTALAQVVVVTWGGGGVHPTGQHAPAGMQAPAQMLPPPGHEHTPPVHVSPVTVQSESMQQSVLGMHVLLAVQTTWPDGHVQVPPGVGHVSPVTLQSAEVQQLVVGMHVWYIAHTV